MVSSYTPTLTALVEARRGFYPILLAEAKALLIAEAASPGLPRLSSVVEEAQTVARILHKSSPLIVGDVAAPGPGAEVNIAMKLLPGASIVHFACHGEQHANAPLESGFCLRDGRLTVAKLMRLSLPRAFFAFLGACETARGDRAQPDQAVHLAATMMFVGFRSVVATMWCVGRYMHSDCGQTKARTRTMGDEDGPFVAKEVYEAIVREECMDLDTIPYALDEAVRKLRERRVPLHRWAPYIHLGG